MVPDMRRFDHKRLTQDAIDPLTQLTMSLSGWLYLGLLVVYLASHPRTPDSVSQLMTMPCLNCNIWMPESGDQEHPPIGTTPEELSRTRASCNSCDQS